MTSAPGLILKGHSHTSTKSGLFSSLFKKMCQPRPLFRLFSVFSNKQYTFYNKLMWKMSIQYLVLGFEFTTFGLWASSFNHWTREFIPFSLSLNFLSISMQKMLYNACVCVNSLCFFWGQNDSFQFKVFFRHCRWCHCMMRRPSLSLCFYFQRPLWHWAASSFKIIIQFTQNFPLSLSLSRVTFFAQMHKCFVCICFCFRA